MNNDDFINFPFSFISCTKQKNFIEINFDEDAIE